MAAGFPYIPETITVHLGAPNDSSAANVTVPFLEYIQNVASSEIYPTWPESAIRANMYAQITYALNRVYTEWYRSRGYDFDITNSTAYDQAFVYGRDIFDNIARIAAEIFDTYLARPGEVQPLFAQYCDGRRVQCDGLSQWGTVPLAQEGKTPYEILTYYYGDNLDIRKAPVRPLAESYPGFPLRLGVALNEVAVLQNRLNRIADSYRTIPKAEPNPLFETDTQQSVRAFQQIFGLTPDGVVGKATWYEIQKIYNAVKRLTDLNAEGIRFDEAERPYPDTLREGSTGELVRALQYYLSVVSIYDPLFPQVSIDGIFGAQTRRAVEQYQRNAGLTVDGVVGVNTWNSLKQTYEDLDDLYNQNLSGIPLFPFPPGQVILLGSQGDAVLQIQNWMNTLSAVYEDIKPLPVTGYYGQNTRADVQEFQELFGLPVTGAVDAGTWQRIGEEVQNLET